MTTVFRIKWTTPEGDWCILPDDLTIFEALGLMERLNIENPGHHYCVVNWTAYESATVPTWTHG
jgi:hypothetical protein